MIFGVTGVDAVGESTSGVISLRAEEKEDVDAAKESRSGSAVDLLRLLL